jgi:Zn-dependent peptidase ImmA (M78 family)
MEAPMRFLIALCLLFACTKKNDLTTEKQEFYNEAIARGCLVGPTDYYFAEIDESIAGYCVPQFGILINSNRWNDLEPLQRKELVFHEFGHCVLGFEHTEIGLMAPSMHSEEELELMWDKYLDMMFAECLKLEDLLKVKE